MFGRLVLGRAAEEVALELVGPRSARELSAIVSKLLELGADMVLVDGALDRMAAASPKVTDAVILATGASLDMDLEAAAQEMGFLVWLLSRPEHPVDAVAALAREAVESDKVCFIDACKDTEQRGHAATHDICSENHRSSDGAGLKIQFWSRQRCGGSCGAGGGQPGVSGQGPCLGEKAGVCSHSRRRGEHICNQTPRRGPYVTQPSASWR